MSGGGRGARVVAAVAAMVLVPAAAAGADAPPLELIKTRQLSPRLVELTLRTPALKAETHVRVLLPDGYDGTARRYPVLYLLHGGADDYTSWTRKGASGGEAERETAGLPLLVVMPDAGQGGWYTDWYNTGAGGPPQWETYHVAQLIPWIDAHYRTLADRGHRAVAGLSMGGFGTMSYAARHPDLFASASSWSGAVDTNTPPEVGGHVIDAIAGLDGATPGSLWGLRETDEVRWRGHNPWDLAANLRGMTLSLRTGDGRPGGPYGGGGDPLEPSVHLMNVSLHERFTALSIDHVWDDYGPGGHGWPYWNRDLREDLPRMLATFAHRPPAPPVVPFTYASIEPAYDVYGWHVALDRPVLEFSTLAGADASGFTLHGSGRATVTTPPLSRPGAPHTVVVHSDEGATTQRLVADNGGRLRIAVPLGPPSDVQEYTVPGTTTGTHEFTTTVAIGGDDSPVAACTPRAAVSVTLRGVRSARVRRVDVYVDGRRHRVLRGRRSAVRVALPGGAARVVRIRLVVHPRRGRPVSVVRLARTCDPTRP